MTPERETQFIRWGAILFCLAFWAFVLQLPWGEWFHQ